MRAGDEWTMRADRLEFPVNKQFVELWYHELDEDIKLVVDPIESLEDVCFHWFLGRFQLDRIENERAIFRCIDHSNKLYFRR